MNVLTYLFPRVLYRGSSKYSRSIEVVESFGNQKLLVNGIVQTGRYPHSLLSRGLRHLSRLHIGPMRQILVLGIGGGDLFHMLSARYPKAAITGVDIDATIVQLAKKYFHLAEIPNTTYVISDAKKYISVAKKKTQRFDTIIVDLYVGNSVPEFVTMKSFFRDITLLLRPKGSMMFNYFIYAGQQEKKQEVHKLLAHIYPVVDMQSNLRNIFFYCRT